MRRLVIDSGIYIDWLNARRHEDILFGPGYVKYLSAVVLMELRAGAFSTKDRRILLRLETTFGRVGRLLSPTGATFSESGDILRRLQSERGYKFRQNHSIVNDVLIAMSARSIGATVATQNARDFRAIQAIRSFALRVLDGT